MLQPTNDPFGNQPERPGSERTPLVLPEPEKKPRMAWRFKVSRPTRWLIYLCWVFGVWYCIDPGPNPFNIGAALVFFVFAPGVVLLLRSLLIEAWRSIKRGDGLALVKEPTATRAVPVEEAKRSRRIPNDVVAEVMRRDEGRCVECGATQDLQLDHIVPFSRGGSNVVSNLQLLCGPCNRRKGALR